MTKPRSGYEGLPLQIVHLLEEYKEPLPREFVAKVLNREVEAVELAINALKNGGVVEFDDQSKVRLRRQA